LDFLLTWYAQRRTRYGSAARAITDAGRRGSGEPVVVPEIDPQLVTLMLVTTAAGLTMLFGGIKKRRLQWRTEPRERRWRDRRRASR